MQEGESKEGESEEGESEEGESLEVATIEEGQELGLVGEDQEEQRDYQHLRDEDQEDQENQDQENQENQNQEDPEDQEDLVDQGSRKDQSYESSAEPSEQGELDRQLSQGLRQYLKAPEEIGEQDKDMPASQEDDPNPEPNLSPACPMTIMPSFTSINMLYHSEPSDQDTFIPDASDNEYSSSQPCSCHTLLRQKLDGTHGLLEDKEGLLLVSTAIRCRLDRLCHFHLRKLAKSSIGLKNNITGAKIIHRLSLVNRYGRRLQQMRASYPNWFVKERRPPTEVDRLGVYQYSTPSQRRAGQGKAGAETCITVWSNS